VTRTSVRRDRGTASWNPPRGPRTDRSTLARASWCSGMEPAELRPRLFHQLGLRFRAVGWWAIGVLLLTGLVNLDYRGWLRWSGVLGAADFWRTAQGHALCLKLFAVINALLGVLSSRPRPDSPAEVDATIGKGVPHDSR
jgi:hypothetical protein